METQIKNSLFIALLRLEQIYRGFSGKARSINRGVSDMDGYLVQRNDDREMGMIRGSGIST
jgi:hypothetical protein